MTIRVGVLRGGPSMEHDVSLKTGEAVLSGLSDKYIGKDIYISKDNDWHLDGMPETYDRIFRSVDVIFNALHGAFGEDGGVQQILEHHGVPYTGSQILSSAIGMNKVLSRNSFERAGLRIPKAFTVDEDDDIAEAVRMIFSVMGPSWVVKPSSSGSSVGISIVDNRDGLEEALSEAFRFSPQVLVEEYIRGREATCGIVDNFRGEENYALPVVEIITPDNFSFFDYKAKYGGETREICPANFSKEIKKEIEGMARKAHEILGCRHYSRADFIISDRPGSDKGNIYLLEVNTLPGLTSESLLPKAISSVGSSYSEFLDHLLTLALGK